MAEQYRMTISRQTVDKLGVKLYDRISAVIAELVANSYDADATRVDITAPMGELLATKSGGKLLDKGLRIEVSDNGSGMTPDEVNRHYLVVGKERRSDPERGSTSKRLGRKVMGRKGVGKLAPFGVCDRVEVITSGGAKVHGKGADGKQAHGYLTAHLVLDRTGIVQDTDKVYHPQPGELDGCVQPNSGTRLILTKFDHRRVPPIADFERQLAQRFGLPGANWQISLHDSLKPTGSPDQTRVVGAFVMTKMPGSEITLPAGDGPVIGPGGDPLDGVVAGFEHDGSFYPVTGWIAYSSEPYRDELMAGIRVYCRGKIAAQTRVFNLTAGFTGEYDIRSYLVGELHADWLDEAEDLIRTDRQDILWTHELGQAFEAWGMRLVRKIGEMTREPRRKRAWQTFKEASKIEERVAEAYPAANQESIRAKTLEMAQLIAKTTRDEDLQDPGMLDSIVQLSLTLGPYITLDEKLREAADAGDLLSAITGILRTARIAELTSFGRIAEDRVRVIEKLEALKDAPGTLEAAFQDLITQAPWLINPQWSPIIANRRFSTLKSELQKFYKQKTGEDLNLDDFSDPLKRADFVLTSQDEALQLIEIKKPNHNLEPKEMERLDGYVKLLNEFLDLPGNVDLKKAFPDFHVTLVCDGLALSGVHKTAFDGLVTKGKLTHINWVTFLLRARTAHQEFLDEAKRLREFAAKN